MNSELVYKLDLLYKMLEKQQDPDTAAALRWAIFTLEQSQGMG